MFGYHSLFYRPQRSCGQGYVFTRVCDSVNGGEGLRRIPPRDQADTPPDQGEPPPPGPRRTPPDQGEPPGTKETPPNQGEPPRTRETPAARQTPPTREKPPLPTPPHPDQGEPPREEAAAYGQWAAGTHPTGMHSCLCWMLFWGFCVILNRRGVRTKISSEKNWSQISKAEEATEMQWNFFH